MKTSQIIWSIVGIVVIVALIYLGVTSTGLTRGQESDGPIKIGLSAPLTGEAASLGESILGGAQLAVLEINEAGGVNGRMLELVVEDDGCSSDGAKAISKLVNIDQVTAIVGPLCSAAGGPGVPIAQEAGVPSIIIASAPHLTFLGDYIFRNYPSDSFQGKFAAEYVYNEMGKRKAGVLFVKNDWGEGLEKVFVARFKELGGEIVFDEGINQDSRDIRTEITKLKSKDFDVVYAPLYPGTGAVGLKQLKELKVTVPVIGGDGFVSDEVFAVKETAGTLYTSALLNGPEEFLNSINERTGKTANIYAPFTYDAIHILATVMEKAGTDQGKIKDELNKIVYEDAVALPTMEFDENGDIKSAEFQVMIIQDGKGVEYKQ
jgi:branched-chain amino acid transport system substrate-binding protein